MSSPVIPVSDDLSRFQTFWARFIANLLDGMVLTPVTLPTTILIGYGPSAVAIAWVIVTAPVGWAYTSYCHGRWGQTLGKRATKIKVVRADSEGSPGYRRALRRDIGSIVFSSLGCVVLVTLIVNGDTDAFRIFHDFSMNGSSQDASETYRRAFSGYNPATIILGAVNSAWALTEVGTMMLNRKRRALHDFIGGTVVVNLEQPGR